MSKRRAMMIGAALLALPGGFVFIPAGTASAEMSPEVCLDFFRIMAAYEDEGDYVTADALFENLDRAGCIIHL